MQKTATMKRICSILLAASSFLWTAPVVAEVRPHYGGTLRVGAKGAPGSLDPGSLAATGPAGLTRVVLATLVKLDDRGYPQSGLATSWQAELGNERRRSLLGNGVSFH